MTRLCAPIRLGATANLTSVVGKEVFFLALEMKPACENCQAVLRADGEAFICSYECTYCAPCAKEMSGVCPNCGGELLRRPRRAEVRDFT